jgi:hypothetical protein
MFTAGNIKWTLGRDRSYLATTGEVLDHFEHCLDVIKRHVQVDEFFGWEEESHDEADGTVRISCRSSDGRPLAIESKRLIKAYGGCPPRARQRGNPGGASAERRGNSPVGAGPDIGIPERSAEG